MKALIRNPGEIILEPFEGIDWITGAPLTNPTWSGGPYTLIDDYQPSEENSEILDPLH